MTKILTIILITLISIGYPSFALEIEIRYSYEFMKQLETDLGEREGEILGKSISYDIRKVFADTSIQPNHILVTIEKAKPNKPTLGQLSGKAGLSHGSSYGTGGMAVSAIVVGANGRQYAPIRESWFSDDIYSAKYSGTWSDANRVSRRFAKLLKKSLVNESQNGHY